MVQVGVEIALIIRKDASFRAIYLAQAALDASLEIVDGSLGTPVAAPVLAGVARFGGDAADVQVFPG
jgi:hypothetical protein